MTTDDATLRKLAEAAPKNWRLRKSRHGPRYAWVSWGRPEEGLGTADLDVPAARYIAAADPQTILALLDRRPSVEEIAALPEYRRIEQEAVAAYKQSLTAPAALFAAFWFDPQDFAEYRRACLDAEAEGVCWPYPPYPRPSSEVEARRLAYEQEHGGMRPAGPCPDASIGEDR